MNNKDYSLSDKEEDYFKAWLMQNGIQTKKMLHNTLTKRCNIYLPSVKSKSVTMNYIA